MTDDERTRLKTEVPHTVAGVRLQGNMPRLVIGVSIILAGILFTLDNLRLVRADSYLSYWPVVLIVIGVAQLVQTRTWSGYGWSLVLIIGGGWMLAQNLGIISLSIWNLSPLLLVLLGASIAWRAYWTPTMAARSAPVGAEAFIRATAVMGGVERLSDSADFRGGDLVAIMGACKLDLRDASISGGEAVIDVFAVMGGVELRIPGTWIVDAGVLPVMGGVTDSSHRVAGQATQRLVIRGIVFMGGVDIKN
jgi:predicted membrane protein